MASNIKHNLSRVKLIHNPNYQRSGLKSYVYLLRKYNFVPTLDGPYFISNIVEQLGKPILASKFASHIGGHARVKQHILMKKDLSSGHEGQVSAEDQQNDSEYLCQVSIGTPAQTLTLDFDTGSSDLWVWSTNLSQSIQTQGKQAGHTIFDPSKSSTWKEASGSTWQISYGDQSSASGTVGTDVVTVGGLAIQNQAVEVANQISDQFVQSTGDGLLGLAWGSINTVQPNPVETPVENMISQDDIPKDSELFTAYLSSHKGSDDSFYTFGYIDTSVTGGKTINYTPVDNSQGFWTIPSTSAHVNGKKIQRHNNTAIMDTGTTLCLVDDAFAKAVYAAIPGGKYDSTQQGYVFPTSTAASDLPVVTLAIGDHQYTINKEDLGFADAGNGMTYGGIQSRGNMTFDIYGDTVLKSIYAIFDQGNQRFGAVQRPDSSTHSS
ncbi:acid protease [Aureobasidium pullulans]|uniref:Acid protease n=1 Tax=Aureobasidium pullulans TaxID=5580 RepID=A0A4V4LG26_AURPU|nr:acid protease [Aureobasidium pullulans]